MRERERDTNPIIWFGHEFATYVECLGQDNLAEPISLCVYHWSEFRIFLLLD